LFDSGNCEKKRAVVTHFMIDDRFTRRKDRTVSFCHRSSHKDLRAAGPWSMVSAVASALAAPLIL
jgi:hypothetical protein